jgi:hypothetical protein
MASLQFGSFFDIPPTDYNQPVLFRWKDFYDFRNHALRVLTRFGTAGPMGEVDLSVDRKDEPEFADTIVDDPDFFVVDDMYNEHDRLSIVECDPRHITVDLILALSDMELAFPGWWVNLVSETAGFEYLLRNCSWVAGAFGIAIPWSRLLSDATSLSITGWQLHFQKLCTHCGLR